MFSEECVILFPVGGDVRGWGGGACVAGRHVWLGGEGVHGWGACMAGHPPPPPHTPIRLKSRRYAPYGNVDLLNWYLLHFSKDGVCSFLH